MYRKDSLKIRLNVQKIKSFKLCDNKVIELFDKMIDISNYNCMFLFDKQLANTDMMTEVFNNKYCQNNWSKQRYGNNKGCVSFALSSFGCQIDGFGEK